MSPATCVDSKLDYHLIEHDRGVWLVALWPSGHLGLVPYWHSPAGDWCMGFMIEHGIECLGVL